MTHHYEGGKPYPTKSVQIMYSKSGAHIAILGAENAVQCNISNVETFAGKGASTPYYKAYKYANKYGGASEEWKHMKGYAYIENEYESGRAEIHWSEHEKFGSFDPFVKRWLSK